MEEDIKVLEEILNRKIEDTEGTKRMKQAIENLINRNKKLEALKDDFEAGFYMPRCDVEEYYVPIERLNDYIEKSELSEILKQRLKKYQDADDGQYKQEYLTRGELELVDRYKECSELLKILCEEDIYKIELDYIPKSKVQKFIEKNTKYISFGEQDTYLQGQRDENDELLDKLQELLQDKE